MLVRRRSRRSRSASPDRTSTRPTTREWSPSGSAPSTKSSWSSRDAVEILPTLAWHYDQPYADPSALPTYYVSQMTRRHVTVALNGDGGDELFGGYERYRALVVHAALPGSLTTPGLRDVAARSTRWIPSGSPGGSGQAARLRGAARGSIDEFNLRLFQHRSFEAEERAQLYSPDFAAQIGPSQRRAVFPRAVAEAPSAGDDPVDRALRADTLMYCLTRCW